MGDESVETCLCPAHRPPCSPHSLEQFLCLDAEAQQQSMGGGTQWTARPKSFPPTPQLPGLLELAAAEPSVPKSFSLSCKALRAQLLSLAVDTYFMTVIQSLLLSTELPLSIKGWRGDSKVSCSQRTRTWNGCLLPKVMDEGTSSDKQGLDKITACVCAYYHLPCLINASCEDKHSSLDCSFHPSQISWNFGVWFFFPLNKACLKMTSHFLSSV